MYKYKDKYAGNKLMLTLTDFCLSSYQYLLYFIASWLA